MRVYIALFVVLFVSGIHAANNTETKKHSVLFATGVSARTFKGSIEELLQQKEEEQKKVLHYSINKAESGDLLALSIGNSGPPIAPLSLGKMVAIEGDSLDVIAEKCEEYIETHRQYEVTLTSLDGIKQLVERYPVFARIVRLYVNNHHIEAFPHDWSCFSQLKHLSLVNNKIKEMPKEVVGLPHLEYLGLDSNQLTQIPMTNGLDRLKTLVLNKNAITAFPASITHFKELGYLHLNGNDFSSVPKTCTIPKVLTLLRVSPLGKGVNVKQLSSCFGTVQETQETNKIIQYKIKTADDVEFYLWMDKVCDKKIKL